jgi:hypothetical protein
MVVAAALGGFTEGFTSGRVKDKTLAMIDGMVDRDIRAPPSIAE